MSFSNLAVSAKIVLCVTLCILLCLIAAGFALHEIGSIAGSYNTTIDHPLTLQRELLEFQGHFRDVRRFTYAISTYAGIDTDQCEAIYASGFIFSSVWIYSRRTPRSASLGITLRVT